MAQNGNENLKSTLQHPVKIAVTGNAGSGKSVVCKYFAEMEVSVISADVLAREVVKPGTGSYSRIVEHFGIEILSDDKTLNRPKLRDLISKDSSARKALESFTHPEIIRRMHFYAGEAGDAGEAIVVFEIPLLFESGLESHFDYIILVTADTDIKVERLVARDHVSAKAAEELIGIQLTDEKKMAFSDFIIKNNSDLKYVSESVNDILARVLQKKDKPSKKA